MSNIGSLIRTMKMTVDEVMDALQFDGEERDFIVKTMGDKTIAKGLLGEPC